jgi:uncharacterized membrane protein
LTHQDRDPDPVTNGAWPLAAVVLLALGLRLLGLDAQSLWVDEVITWKGANLPLGDLLSLRSYYAMAHSLYFAMMHGVVSLFGDGETALRLPSVLFGAASVPLLYLIGRDWFGHRVGLAAAFLLAISPLHLYYSQEARPYAAVVCFALASMVCLNRVLEGRRWFGWQVGFAVSFAAMLFCHPIALAFVSTIVLQVVLAQERLTLAPVRGVLIGAGVATVALLLVLVALPPIRPVAVESRGLAALPYTVWAFSVGYSLGPSVRALHTTEPMRVALQHAPLIAGVLLLTGGLVLLGVMGVWRQSRVRLAILLVWLAGPIGFVLIGAQVTGHAYNVRYVIPAFPAFLLLLACGIESIRWDKARAVAWTAVLAVCTVSLLNYFTSPNYAKDDYRSAVGILAARARPGEMVLVNEAYTQIMLDYYDPGPVRVVGFPLPQTGRDWERAKSDLDRLTEGRTRWWLLLGRPGPNRLGTRIPGYVDHRFERGADLSWSGTRLLLYRSPGSR